MVCANDSQAVGVSRALHEHGMRIPQDVSLVGFDDMPAMDNMYPPLSTVRPDFEQLGVAAMRETLFLLGEGDENSFASSQHGVGLILAVGGGSVIDCAKFISLGSGIGDDEDLWDDYIETGKPAPEG